MAAFKARWNLVKGTRTQDWWRDIQMDEPKCEAVHCGMAMGGPLNVEQLGVYRHRLKANKSLQSTAFFTNRSIYCIWDAKLIHFEQLVHRHMICNVEKFWRKSCMMFWSWTASSCARRRLVVGMKWLCTCPCMLCSLRYIWAGCKWVQFPQRQTFSFALNHRHFLTMLHLVGGKCL